MPGHPGAWRALSPGTAGKGLRGAALEGLGLAGPPGDCPARMGGTPSVLPVRTLAAFPASVTCGGHCRPPHTHTLLSEPSAREPPTPAVQTVAAPAPARLREAAIVTSSHKMKLKPKTTQSPVEARPPALGSEPLPLHPASCFPNSALRP